MPMRTTDRASCPALADLLVFLLSSTRAELELHSDLRTALVEGLASCGRVINAAGGVMVVVFFTFALSGPLAPKEMGVILGVAVLLDTLLIRLLLLPATRRLLGPHAWWAARRLARPSPGLQHGVDGAPGQPLADPMPGR
jgi:putative drug exporter of the RND superfamily